MLSEEDICWWQSHCRVFFWYLSYIKWKGTLSHVKSRLKPAYIITQPKTWLALCASCILQSIIIMWANCRVVWSIRTPRGCEDPTPSRVKEQGNLAKYFGETSKNLCFGELSNMPPSPPPHPLHSTPYGRCVEWAGWFGKRGSNMRYGPFSQLIRIVNWSILLLF